MNDCIVWSGYVTPLGYGQSGTRRHGTRLAHRIAWIEAHGPIHDGMCICHTCDNPACVNVEHLFVGTQKDNLNDMATKGRHRNQSKTHCPKGHEYDGIDMNGKRTCSPCKRAAEARYNERRKIKKWRG